MGLISSPPTSPLSAHGETIVIVLGKVGSGKSTFVNCAVGKEVSPLARGLIAMTSVISPFALNHPKDSSHRVILVDTPGLGTGAREDHKIMTQLAEWLKKSVSAKVPRKIAILYLIEIDKNLSPKSDVYTFPKNLISQGVSKNSIIVTTKWEKLFDAQPGHERRNLISQEYSSHIPIHTFENKFESAWKIIDKIDGRAVDVTRFRRKLKKVVSIPLFDQFLTIFGFGNQKNSGPGENMADVVEAEASEVRTEVDSTVVTRLQELSSKLGPVFADKDNSNYRKLLACRGPEAQALLDTFQSILRADIEKGAARRNLIYATKRLSTKSHLYPGVFMLDGVERLDEQPVASGAFADICRGTFQKQPVCLKVLRIIQGASYEKVTKMIAREGILWGQLSHQNLLPLWGLFRLERHLSLVCPWVNNGSLVQYIAKNPRADRVLLCADIVDGIDYLHKNEIVHGDLKGVNILVTDSGRACLADFGISSIKDPEIVYWATQSAAAGGAGGTVRWQAPELFETESKDGEDCETSPSNTKAVDIYAWSCICLEVFTGAAPFAHIRLDTKVLLKVSQGARPSLPEDEEPYISLGMSPVMRQLMDDCWTRDPKQRPHAEEVLQRLAAVKPPDTRPPVGWKPGPAMNMKSLTESDVPLTVEKLEEILRREPPPPSQKPLDT